MEDESCEAFNKRAPAPQMSSTIACTTVTQPCTEPRRHECLLVHKPGFAELAARRINELLGTRSIDWATVAYDTATGDQEWIGTYNGPASRTESAVQSSDGSFFSSDFGTVAYLEPWSAP